MQEGKKKRQNRATAKKFQFQEVLREHMQHALEANATVKQGTSGKVCQTFLSAKGKVTKLFNCPQTNSRSEPVPKPGSSGVLNKLCTDESPTASCSYEKVYELAHAVWLCLSVGFRLPTLLC